jgi:hypothetical protein
MITLEVPGQGAQICQSVPGIGTDEAHRRRGERTLRISDTSRDIIGQVKQTAPAACPAGSGLQKTIPQLCSDKLIETIATPARDDLLHPVGDPASFCRAQSARVPGECDLLRHAHTNSCAVDTSSGV